MGQFIGGNSGASVAPGTQGVGTLTADTAVAVNDAILIGPAGKGRKIVCTDYASISTLGQIAAQTQVQASRFLTGKNGAIQGADGSFYVPSPYSGNNGLKISRYTAGGSLLSTLNISTAATQSNNPQLFVLSNGNILVAWGFGSGGSNGALCYAIFTPGLTAVAGIASQRDCGEVWNHPGAGDQYTQNCNFFGCVALPAGGFAITFQSGSNTALQRFIAFDNAGAVTTALKTIQTWTGSAGVVYTDAKLLSNNNIVIGCYSKYTTTVGTYHAVVNGTGTSVKAFTNLEGTITTSVTPQISVLPGYYAIGRVYANTNVKVWVLNNAGTTQGDAYTSSAGDYGDLALRLVNDLTNFYALWGARGIYTLTTIPITGTNFVDRNTGLSNAAAVAIDAAIEGTMLVLMQATGSTGKNKYAVVNLVSGTYITALTDYGTAPSSSNNGLCPRILLGGDFTFIGIYDYASAETTNFFIQKYASTAVAGIALTAAAAGSTFNVATGSGVFACNTIKGSPSKAFNHGYGSPAGNRGSLQQNSITLGGFASANRNIN